MKTLIALLMLLGSVAASAADVTLNGTSGNSCEYTSATLRPDGRLTFECSSAYPGFITFALGGPGSTFVMTPICSGQQHAIRFTKTSDANVLRVWASFATQIRSEVYRVSPQVITPVGPGGYTFIPIEGAPNRELVVLFTPEYVGYPGYVPCNPVRVEVY